jgi:hypothetical protein
MLAKPKPLPESRGLHQFVDIQFANADDWVETIQGVIGIEVDGVMPTCSLSVVRDPKTVGLEVLNAENFACLQVWSVAEGI